MLISTSIDELAVFADHLRAEIIELLAEQQLCTCHLVEMTGARQPTISHHLKILRDIGLVETESVGRNTYYRLLPEKLEVYSGLLADLARRAATASKVKYPCAYPGRSPHSLETVNGPAQVLLRVLLAHNATLNLFGAALANSSSA